MASRHYGNALGNLGGEIRNDDREWCVVGSNKYEPDNHSAVSPSNQLASCSLNDESALVRVKKRAGSLLSLFPVPSYPLALIVERAVHACMLPVNLCICQFLQTYLY